MSDLNEQQKERFSAMNVRLGLAPMQSTVASNVNLQAAVLQPKVLSSNPAESDIPPYIIAVGSIAELNKLIGAPDDGDDSSVQYPPSAPVRLTSAADTAQSRAELIGSLDDSAINSLKNAAAAYLKGNPAKVADYEPLINAVLFPGKIAVFSDPGNLNVAAGETLVIKGDDPLVLNYGSITVGENARVIVESEASINTQIMTQL